MDYIGCALQKIQANNHSSKRCDPAIGGSLVGGDKQPLRLQKFGDALRTFTLLKGLPELSRLTL